MTSPFSLTACTYKLLAKTENTINPYSETANLLIGKMSIGVASDADPETK